MYQNDVSFEKLFSLQAIHDIQDKISSFERHFSMVGVTAPPRPAYFLTLNDTHPSQAYSLHTPAIILLSKAKGKAETSRFSIGMGFGMTNYFSGKPSPDCFSL